MRGSQIKHDGWRHREWRYESCTEQVGTTSITDTTSPGTLVFAAPAVVVAEASLVKICARCDSYSNAAGSNIIIPELWISGGVLLSDAPIYHAAVSREAGHYMQKVVSQAVGSTTYQLMAWSTVNLEFVILRGSILIDVCRA